MIKYEKHILKNGLKVIAHKDSNSPIAAFNLLYNVGAKNEDPERTGLAHLFEHLMFEGSANVKEFDVELQDAGGENNAFTNNDITNYYCTLPVENIETAFYLESDRMFQPAFSEAKLQTQKKVVIEEFKQSYLNQPYGDVMLLLRPLAYKYHPYRWPTIGMSPEHIEKIDMQHVKDFFNKFYKPNNAVLAVTGNIDPDKVFKLAEKWFGDILPGVGNLDAAKIEPAQNERRFLHVEREVPYDEIFIAFHSVERLNDNYYGIDLISDILGNGNSSRLYKTLLKEKNLFSKINAWITGSIDPGLIVINGRLVKGESIESAEEGILNIINDLKSTRIEERELQKVKNKIEAVHAYSAINVLPKATNLAYYEYLGDANLLNKQVDKYFEINIEKIQKISMDTFSESNASVLHYCALKK